MSHGCGEFLGSRWLAASPADSSGDLYAEQIRDDNGEVFVYFSFVTLTSLGYGDVTPASPGVRILAILEALVGQLYVAMLIARLVGLRITQPQDEK